MSEPKCGFGKTGSIDGVWINNDGGDVHVYRDHANKVMVIGRNKSMRVKFTDPALVFHESGELSLQTDDGKGNPEYTKIDPAMFAGKLTDFLNSLKG